MKKISLFLLLLTPLFLSACSSEPLGDPTPQRLGNANAPVLIEEFSDPECPFCALVSPQLEKFVIDNQDLAKLEYYNFPLPYHEYGFMASEGAECAGDQGQFFQYLNTIFENQKNLNEDYLYKVADSLKLNRTTFDQCLKDHKHKGKILAQVAIGTERKLPGTPSIFVDGQMVQWTDAETFKGYVKSVATKKATK